MSEEAAAAIKKKSRPVMKCKQRQRETKKLHKYLYFDGEFSS